MIVMFMAMFLIVMVVGIGALYAFFCVVFVVLVVVCVSVRVYHAADGLGVNIAREVNFADLNQISSLLHYRFKR